MSEKISANYLSPVVVFAYNRPYHTKQLLDSLALNEESSKTDLFLICDGPKNNASPEQQRQIKEVADIAQSEKRFGKTITINRDSNYGLASSIMDGVTMILEKHETVIVLEDDLVVSPYFLHYMNDSLIRYQCNERVGQIGACNIFACGEKFPQSFFIPIPDCLGWATWKNRWINFEPDAAKLLESLKQGNLIHKFNVYGSYDMLGMLKNQINGQGTSWAVRWTAVCVINNWLTLYPNPSFTNHIESYNSTNFNLSILPPLCKIKPVLETVEVIEIPSVIKAMRRGYSGNGDFYGNLKYSITQQVNNYIFYKWQKLKTLLKRLFLQ